MAVRKMKKVPETDPILHVEDPALLSFLNYLLNERNASGHTVNSYRIDIMQFASLVLSEWKKEETKTIRWDLATVHDARTFIVKLQERGISKVSTVRKLSAMRAFYRFLERENRSSINPFAGLVAPKKEKRLPKFMTVSEVGRLLDAPASFWRERLAVGIAKTDESAELGEVRDSAILEVLYSGGLRINEAMGLNLGDIDLISDVMKIRGKGKKERLAALGGPAVRA